MRAAAPLCLMLLMQAIAASYAAAAAQLKLQEQQLKMDLHAKDTDGDGKADEHDTSFDHEMFLGKARAEIFSGLRGEEAKKLLGALFDDRIDGNKDGKVSKEELIKWMHQVAQDQVQKDVDAAWRRQKKSDSPEPLSWAKYVENKMPGALPDLDEAHVTAVLKVLRATSPAEILKAGTVALPPPPKSAPADSKVLQESLVSDLVRDSRRWVAADGDKDGMLSKPELHQFYYPDEFPHMREVLVQESMDHADKNHDGKVTLEEFLTDMWSPTKDSEEKEPEWVAEERKSFREVKDKNKDGYMDKSEYTAYLFSHDEDRAELYRREAEHLINEADSDKDGALSRSEMVGSLELFAGSAATNYGDHIGLREDL